MAGQLLLQAQQLVAMNRPADRDHMSVQNFMDNGKPLLQADSGFINEKEDLVTLRPGRENAWFDGFVERMLKMCHCKPLQVLIPYIPRRFLGPLLRLTLYHSTFFAPK